MFVNKRYRTSHLDYALLFIKILPSNPKAIVKTKHQCSKLSNVQLLQFVITMILNGRFIISLS